MKGKTTYDEPTDWYPNVALKIYINLSKENTSYFRRVYTLLDAFGDAGGLLESVMIILGLLVSPFYFKIQPMHYFNGFTGDSCCIEPLPRFFLVKWYIFDWLSFFRIKCLAKYLFCCIDWKKFEIHKFRVKYLTKVDTEISNF